VCFYCLVPSPSIFRCVRPGTHSLLLNIGSSLDNISYNARINSLGQLVYEDVNIPGLSSYSPTKPYPIKVVAVNLKDRRTFSFPLGVILDFYPSQSFTIFPNDSILAINGPGVVGLIQFWDLNNGKLLGNINDSTNYSNIAVSPDGAMFVGLSEKNLLTIFNVQGLRAKLVSKIPLKSKQFTVNHKGNITFLSFTPDHQVLATASEDKTIKLWDVNTGTLLKTISEHKNTVTSLAFSPDNKTLVTSDKDGKIMVWRND
jgi:WD40 repeat protein